MVRVSQEGVKKIIEEAKRIEEDCLYSSKRQFETANTWMRIHYWIGIPATVFSAIAGVSILSQSNSYIIAGFLAIMVAALIAVSTFLNPNEKATLHHNAGNRYNALKEKARYFYQIECINNADFQQLKEKLKELSRKKEELNKDSPLTHRKAYEKAKKGIQNGEADYNVDKK